MVSKFWSAVLAASCAAAWLAPSATAAPAAAAANRPTFACGGTITVDTTLTNDLTNCHGIGLVIGADHVTLDLNGHTVDGDGVSDFEGVQAQGHSGVTVEHGTVRDFVEGIAVLGGKAITVRRVALSGHRHVGIFVDGS